MSAIVGAFNLDGRPVERRMVAEMLQAVAHRGPDGLITHASGAIGLGQGLFQGSGVGCLRPVDANRDLTIVADCRLDNRDELIAALGEPHDRADSELIMAAYRCWAEACVTRLEGDFAFAIWDPSRQRLFCARDHFGVRPLVYFYDGRRFLFASEVKAVGAAGLPAKPVDDLRVAEFLAGLPPAGQATFSPGVLRLPPAHSCTVDAQGVRLRRYWALQPLDRPRGDVAGQLQERLRTAVRRRMGSDASAGAMLSGGLDSSSIACLARDVIGARRSLPTYSMVFDQSPQWDERPFIMAVLDQGGFAPTFLTCDEHPPFRDLATALQIQDGPFLAPNLSMQNRTLKAAAADGVRVMLDGHGGDEVIGHGWGRLSELSAKLRWISLYRQLCAMREDLPTTPAKALRGYVRAFAPAPESMRARSRAAAAIPLLHPDLALRPELTDRLAAMRPRSPMELARHVQTVTCETQAYGLEVLDRAAAAAGVEVRYPFWDKDLVEFCVSIDPSEKLSEGWTRRSLRTAMQGVLPPKVQWRRDKLDFTPHLVGGMLRHSELIRCVVSDLSGDLAPYVDLAQLTAAHDRVRAAPGEARSGDVHAIGRAVVLSVWLRRRRGESIDLAPSRSTNPLQSRPAPEFAA